jgi:hypothetical protein
LISWIGFLNALGDKKGKNRAGRVWSSIHLSPVPFGFYFRSSVELQAPLAIISFFLSCDERSGRIEEPSSKSNSEKQHISGPTFQQAEE